MKKHLITLVLLTALSTVAQGQTVRGYQKSNGTVVQPYFRAPADGIVQNNASYRPGQFAAPKPYSGSTYAAPASRPISPYASPFK